AWDVRQMAAHMLGMAEMAASIRESLRQQRKATRAGGTFIDALNQLQVDERRDWTPERITERYAARVPRAVAGRRRTPSSVRRPPTPPAAQARQRPPAAWALGLPRRRHLAPRPGDAPPGHRPRRGPRATPDRRSRWRDRRGRRRRVGRPPRQGLRADADRPRRRCLEGWHRRAALDPRPHRPLPRPLHAPRPPHPPPADEHPGAPLPPAPS